jgi:hypothetical protein
MDLLAAAVQRDRAVAYQRRLHFNAGMLELHSRIHELETSRAAQEQRQMEAYAAAVMEQQQRERDQRQQQQQHATRVAEQNDEDSSAQEPGGWQQILRLDPIAQKLRRSKLARLAFRRWVEAALLLLPCAGLLIRAGPFLVAESASKPSTTLSLHGCQSASCAAAWCERS